MFINQRLLFTWSFRKAYFVVYTASHIQFINGEIPQFLGLFCSKEDPNPDLMMRKFLLWIQCWNFETIYGG
jgi:hypothetical protein